MVWIFVIGAIVAVIFVAAYIAAMNDLKKSKRIICPSCEQETNFLAGDEVLKKCGYCKTLILENGDGTYRAHAIATKKDAS